MAYYVTVLVLVFATVTTHNSFLALAQACETIDAAFQFNGKLHAFFGDSFITFNDQKEEDYKGSIYEWGGLKGPVNAAISGLHEHSAYFFEWPRVFTYSYNKYRGAWISKMHPSFFKQSVDAACHRQNNAYFFRKCEVLVWHHKKHESDRLNMTSLGLPCDVDAAWEDNDVVVVLKGNMIWRWGTNVVGPSTFHSYATLNTISLCHTSQHRETTTNNWFWETDGYDKVFQKMRLSNVVSDKSPYLAWSNPWMRPFGHKKDSSHDTTPCAVDTDKIHGLSCVNINAALRHKGLLYLFHGDSYVTLDSSYTEVNVGPLSDWGNVTSHIDAALSGFPLFFFNGRRYFSYYLGKRHGPWATSEWDPMFTLGVDAAGEKNGTTYLLRGCSFKTFRSDRTGGASTEFQLGDYGLPCFMDAAFTKDDGTLVLVKDDRLWYWGDGIEGPTPLASLITLKSWRICSNGGGAESDEEEV